MQEDGVHLHGFRFCVLAFRSGCTFTDHSEQDERLTHIDHVRAAPLILYETVRLCELPFKETGDFFFFGSRLGYKSDSTWQLNVTAVKMVINTQRCSKAKCYWRLYDLTT